MKALSAGLVLAIVAVPALAQDQSARDAGPVACMPAQAVVPPFNNTPGAMEQSRVAATILTDARTRAGDKPIRICRKSAIAPQISDAEGVDEVPVDPDYEPEGQ